MCEDHRSAYGSNYLAICFTNSPVFSFQVYFPLRGNHSNSMARHSLCLQLSLHRVFLQVIQQEGTLWYHWRKKNCQFFSSFSSLFTLRFWNSVVCFLPNYGIMRGLFSSVYAIYPRPFFAFCIRCFFPNYYAIHWLLELFLGFPRRGTIHDCCCRELNGDPSISFFVGDCAYRICVEQISPPAFHTGSLSFRGFFINFFFHAGRWSVFFLSFFFFFGGEKEPRRSVEGPQQPL